MAFLLNSSLVLRPSSAELLHTDRHVPLLLGVEYLELMDIHYGRVGPSILLPDQRSITAEQIPLSFVSRANLVALVLTRSSLTKQKLFQLLFGLVQLSLTLTKLQVHISHHSLLLGHSLPQSLVLTLQSLIYSFLKLIPLSRNLEFQFLKLSDLFELVPTGHHSQ